MRTQEAAYPTHAPTLGASFGAVGAYRISTWFTELEKLIMCCRGVALRTILLLVVVGTVLCVPSLVMAQATAGVAVDAQGVLRKQLYADPGGQLARQRIEAARATLDPQLTAFNPMRKVSLNRLEQAIRKRQGVPTGEMRHLAGLLRVKYVFFYPESNDIVIAGPAEGWITDASGRVMGITSGRPIVQLQDLVVALRAFPPGKGASPLIGCSIDPTAEGLAEMQRFLRSTGSHATPADTQYIVTGLQTALGLQEVSVHGISPKTHFAQVMVEADYRMKLIGIGLEEPPVRMVSFVDRANPARVSRNALQRWYFTPDYECVRASDDGLAIELVGDGVKLIGADEMVTDSGQRRTASRGDSASRAFVDSFTQKYSQLAERSPVYAELRNLIDLSIAAAYIQQEDFCHKAGWKMEFFGDEKAFAVETYNAPTKVGTAVNAIWRGRRLMTPIGGGVTIHADEALVADNLLEDKNGKVAEARKATKLELAEGQWWWD